MLLAAVIASGVAYAEGEQTTTFGPSDVSYTEDNVATGTTSKTPKVDTYYSNVTGEFDITAGEGVDVKLKLSGKTVTVNGAQIQTDGNTDNDEVRLGTINAASTWLSHGRFVAAESTDLANAGDLYINGGSLQIADGITLNNKITLGSSSYASGWPDSLKSAALVVGLWSKANETVTFTGVVDIVDNAKICMQSGYNLNLTGDLVGSADLEFSRYSNNGNTNSIITFSGSAAGYTGNITINGFEQDNKVYTNTLKLTGTGTNLLTNAASITVGTNAKLDLSEVAGVTLTDKITNNGTIVIGQAITNNAASIGTLEVAEVTEFDSSNLTYTGTSNTANGFLTSVSDLVIITNTSANKEGISVLIDGTTLTTDSEGKVTGNIESTIFRVNSGTESLISDIVNKASEYRVAADSTLDINAQKLVDDKVILAKGATLSNGGSATGDNQKQLPKLEFTGNAYVDASNGSYGLIEGSYNESHLWLNGHTLTKKGNGEFYLVNTTIHGGGTILISEGTFKIGTTQTASKTTRAADSVFDTGSQGTLSIINGDTLQAAGVVGTGGKIVGASNTTLLLESAEDYSYGGVVEGGFQLTKKGSGTHTFTGNTTLGTVTGEAGGISFNGSSNSLNVLDLSAGDTSTAQMLIGGAVTVNSKVWLGTSAGITLTKDASLTRGSVTIKGNGTKSATISRNSEDSSANSADLYEITNQRFTVSNAKVEVATAEGGATISNRLINVALTNTGTGTLVASNGYNTYTALVAKAGNLNICGFSVDAGNNVQGNLELLEIAAGKTIGVHTSYNSSINATSDKATIAVSGAATFGAGANLHANLTLNDGAVLTLGEGGLDMNDSVLTLGSSLTLNSETVQRIMELAEDEVVELFTNVSELILGEQHYTAGSLTSDDGVALGTVFNLSTEPMPTELTAAANTSYYLGFDGKGTVYAAQIVPEPTTATLSLLALAALAARRRRASR